MKLFTMSASPFGRKVRVVIEEKGLQSQVEIINDNPWKAETQVPAINPVGKVPVLITDSGSAIYDSAIISEYLDSNGPGQTLFPREEPSRWVTLRRASLADQTLDAFILARLENNRPTGEKSENWLRRQHAVVGRCLDAMEGEISTFPEHPTIAHIAFGVALGHLDFRRGPKDANWRDGRSALASWYGVFSERAAMQATLPHD